MASCAKVYILQHALLAGPAATGGSDRGSADVDTVQHALLAGPAMLRKGAEASCRMPHADLLTPMLLVVGADGMRLVGRRASMLAPNERREERMTFSVNHWYSGNCKFGTDSTLPTRPATAKPSSK